MRPGRFLIGFEDPNPKKKASGTYESTELSWEDAVEQCTTPQAMRPTSIKYFPVLVEGSDAVPKKNKVVIALVSLSGDSGPKESILAKWSGDRWQFLQCDRWRTLPKSALVYSFDTTVFAM